MIDLVLLGCGGNVPIETFPLYLLIIKGKKF